MTQAFLSLKKIETPIITKTHFEIAPFWELSFFVLAHLTGSKYRLTQPNDELNQWGTNKPYPSCILNIINPEKPHFLA